ncbi:MAG: hypothetical protein IJS93_00600 [Clostridia bacterium]|nr:hypothetical protein [Clostridia bacterium]
MLNKKETVIMREIYKRTVNNNGTCIIRPVDLMASIPYSVDINKTDLQSILIGLEYDEYFTIEEKDENGEYYLHITLQKKGFAFQRSEEQRIRNQKSSIISKIALTLLGVVLAFVLRWLIQFIFSKGG